MKNWLFAVMFLLAIGFTFPQDVQAKVIWDNSEIVERQAGKMSFKKDVKVYKKLPNGKFTSLVVKKNDFYRVYDIEKYNGKVYYWMSSGYRVEATNLVNFKAVPMEIRASFYENPGYIISNQAGVSLPKGFGIPGISYGHQIDQFYSGSNSYMRVSFDKEYAVVNRLYQGVKASVRIHGTDIKIVSQRIFREGHYHLKSDVVLRYAPLFNTTLPVNLKAGSFVNVATGELEVNGYIRAYLNYGIDYGYVPVSYLE